MLEKNKVIGKTPMIKLRYKYHQKTKQVYAKLESYNLTGSIKDRVAFYIIQHAKKRGELKEEMPIVEATSGNTGIALAALGSFYHHPVHIFMPDWASTERIQLMKNYGAKVYLVSREEGGFIKCVERARDYAKENNGFLANQFSNKDNYLAHFETTGEEILKQCEKIDAFISGVGTGGTLMGISDKLKQKYPKMKTIAIEPDKMPILSGGEIKGGHKIEGIGDDFIPDLVDRTKIDQILLIHDEDAINMARRLAKELGLGVGISSGANLIGCVLSDVENPVTVFADDNKKYLSTDLSKEINPCETLISNQIELLGYEMI